MKYEKEVIELFKNYLLEFKKIEIEISLDTKLNSDLSIDSLDVVEILVSLEKKMGIFIPVEDLTSKQFQTIKEVCSFLEKYEPRSL